MADVYQYPVYFDCPQLLEQQQMKKLEIYFLVRRRSGGGECGPVRRHYGHVYSVAFKRQTDQQSVLQRSQHAVDGLVFTVRGGLEPHASNASQSSHSIPASTPSPSGEEYELRLDTYLVRYLNECPKAGKELEEKLASVASCSAQLYPDEGRILLRSLAQPGAVDEVRDWEAEARKIFDGYQCYYEMDSHKIKALLRSCSSTDEVKVYSEVGMAVIVGEYSQVQVRLMDVEERPGSSEKHTTVCLLGRVKLRLLWKEIKQSLEDNFPKVKVTKGDAGKLVLEGSVEDILKAGDWISSQATLVFERKVSDMSPYFLAFLRKAYEDPGMLGNLLEVDDLVEVELRDTELRFFSLSADKLEDTEKKLKEKFKEVKIDLPNCAAVPHDLRQNLTSITNEMNQVQYRAQVGYSSGSTVILLGHTKEVKELSEAVTQFILGQERHDPLVKAKVNTASSGQVRYSHKSTGEDEILFPAQNVASLSLCEVNTVASYTLQDGLQVQVCHGDITKQDVDAIVNVANEDLEHTGGVAAALSKAGGPEVQKESRTLVKQCGKIPTGEAVVTTGGNLKCKKLLHAVVGRNVGRKKTLLEKAVESALKLSETMGFESVAIPCISNRCSEAIVTTVKRFGCRQGQHLSRIILIDEGEEVVRAMVEACDRLLQVTQDDTAGGTTVATPGNGVSVEIVQGTIETQQVDAVVSPMVGHDPLSTRVGNTLFSMIGPQLTASYRSEAGKEMLPGDTVLVEGLPGLPFNAVHFLSLVPWDDDEDGTAVQILRLGINKILTSCENRGFGSVALPVLGAGIALQFPDHVVHRVVLGEIHDFKQNRVSRTPFVVRIVIHPNDEEAFKSAQETLELSGHAKDALQPDQESSPTRIVLLGKTGSGKSSLANTIFGEELFKSDHTPTSGTRKCQAETRPVNGRNITLIDTPGFFDTRSSEEDLKPEIVKCITECAPGPHAFLIVLKVEKYTEHEQAVIDKICKYFSVEALRYAVVVFTHGEQLKGTIEEFVSQDKNLSDLVQKCGGRCHVFDNDNWNNEPGNNYQSNQFHVENLLSTIDKMVIDNNGRYFTNKLLQTTEKEIKKEEAQIRQTSGNMSKEEITRLAKSRVSDRFLIKLVGISTGVLLGAFFGLAGMVGLVITALQNVRLMKLFTTPALGKVAAAAGGGEVALAVGVVAGVGCAAAGGAIGGIIAHDAIEGAETPMEAAEMAANAIINKGKDLLKF